jgi:hypothetical protein
MTPPAANPSGDQLIREYLTRVTHSALRLPKGARMAFIGRTRARIERELGPDGAEDPGRVVEVLQNLGEPDDLVAVEREKIDAEWAKRRAATRERNEANATSGRYRRLDAPWRPSGTESPPTGGAPPVPPPRAGAGGPAPAVGPAAPAVGHAAPADPAVPDPGAPPAPAAAVPGPAAAPGAAGPPAPDAPAPPGGPGAGPGPVTRPMAPVPSAPAGPELTLATVAGLARENLLEAAVIVLLGLGGLFFPILPPVWVLGSLLALLSRVWGARDKWAALLGPIALTALGSVLIALVRQGSGNFVVIYVQAFGAGAGYLLRLSCLVCAGYLGWRVYRGPRVKVPPWRRHTAVPGGR